MREVTSEYLSQVKSGARQFGFYVNIYGNGPEPETLWLADIISVKITRSASDQLQIGACMSDRLTLQTRATTLFNGRGKKIVVYYRCTAPILGWVKLGTFYVDKCVTQGGITAVTAYDMMSRLDKRMTWTGSTAPTFPCTMQDMLDYICARAGVTTDFTCQNITIEKTPDGYTARELISYIAASHGANARFSPSEVLQIRPYTQTSEVIQYGECYSMNIDVGGYEVKGILFECGGNDMIYIDGTSSEYDADADGIVQAFNPFAAIGIAEYAWNNLGGLSYSAVNIEMPATNVLELGDVFTVLGADGTEKTAIVMEQTLSASCNGGFVETISCTAESKNQTRNAENRAAAAEKEIKNSVVSTEKLQTTGSQYYAVTKGTDAAGEDIDGLILSNGETELQILDKSTLSSDGWYSAGWEIRDKRGLCFIRVLSSMDKSGAQIHSGSSDITLDSVDGLNISATYKNDNDIDERASITIDKNGIVLLLDNNGACIELKPSFFRVQFYDEESRDWVRITMGSGIFHVFASGQAMDLKSDGLYVGGKKVLTEEF